jgi:Cd(II)/Pb(II)-responsive transcriptional regulator
MKIGELARQVGTAVATVRYYEQQGLLPPPARLGNNYRHYSQAHVQRLQFILRCRSLDMSLAEIAQLLQHQDQPQASCGEVNALLDQHIAQVAQQLAELQQLQAQLQALRASCQEAQSVAACGIMQSLKAGAGAELGLA